MTTKIQSNSKGLFRLLMSILLLLLLTGFDDPDFPSLPKLKSVTEWREWADTSENHEKSKWLKSKREYFPNGELRQVLYVEYNGDTTGLTQYKLNRKSRIKKDIWYNRFLNKWMQGDRYYYKKGETQPYMTKDQDKYRCFYNYDLQKRIRSRRLVDSKRKAFVEYEFMYDSTGLMNQQIEYDFFDDQRDVKRVYVYEYEKDDQGRVIKKESYFVPHTNKESVTKTDKQGNQRTTYYGFTAKDKTLMETVFYNEKGERIRKIEYDRDNRPQFISTYHYEYFD